MDARQVLLLVSLPATDADDAMSTAARLLGPDPRPGRDLIGTRVDLAAACGLGRRSHEAAEGNLEQTAELAEG